MNPNTLTLPVISTETDSEEGLAWRVVLYNDDYHSFDEVAHQIRKAIACSLTTAYGYTYEAHYNGKTVVFGGGLPECLKVVSILEEIALHTEIIT